MISLVAILLLISFLESTLLPINLVLLILMARTFVAGEKNNYYLAFIFGFTVSLFWGYQLGSLSIVYLISVYVVKIVKKMDFSSHWLSILPLLSILLFADKLVMSQFFRSSINWLILIVEILLVIPIYFIVRFWEERFIPKKEIKLKISK